MYCRNCNKEIPDAISFCPYCGIQQSAVPMMQPDAGYTHQQGDDSATVLVDNPEAANVGFSQNNYAGNPVPSQPYQQQNPVYQQPNIYQQPVFPAYNQPVQQPKKSKTALIIGIVAGAVGLLIIFAVILVVAFGSSEPFYEDSYDDVIVGDDVLDDLYDDSADNFDSYVDDSYAADEVSAEFQKILDDNALTFVPFDFGDLDYVAYGVEDYTGMIDIQEFGCNGDYVEEWYETICYPITGYTQDEVDALDENMRAAFAQFEALDFCFVDYYRLEDFYVIELYLTELDTVSNVEKLQELDMVESGFVLYISISQTESDLVSQGYVKR